MDYSCCGKMQVLDVDVFDVHDSEMVSSTGAEYKELNSGLRRSWELERRHGLRGTIEPDTWLLDACKPEMNFSKYSYF
jgi:hypothetical protein